MFIYNMVINILNPSTLFSAYLSSIGEYRTFNQIFKSTFRRHFYMTGFANEGFVRVFRFKGQG